MKRLLALVAGGLGLRALLRRRSRPPASASPSPAEDLRAKLAHAKAQDTTQAREPEVDERRADVHAKARQAIDDLGAP